MPKQKYKITLHHLAEINDIKALNEENLAKAEYWNIYIASDGINFKGKAIDANKKRYIPWTTLKEQDHLKEVIEMCKRNIANR